MIINAKSKFEIGEIALVKGTVCKVLISAIFTDTCYAGTQVSYHCLNLIPIDRFRLEKNENNLQPYVWEKEVRFNEVLLEKITNKEV